jgi:hypothetical protein
MCRENGAKKAGSNKSTPFTLYVQNYLRKNPKNLSLERSSQVHHKKLELGFKKSSIMARKQKRQSLAYFETKYAFFLEMFGRSGLKR